MKKLYILRHAIAVERGADGYRDSERPLTKRGIARFSSSLKGIAELDPDWQLVCSSPLSRALQTAELLTKFFDQEKNLKIEPSLKPGHSASDVVNLFKVYLSKKSLLIVGHEPYLSLSISQLLAEKSSSFLELKKGALACLSFQEEVELGKAQLVYLIPPKILRNR